MKNIIKISIIAILIFHVIPAQYASANEKNPSEKHYREGEIIVKYKSKKSKDRFLQSLEKKSHKNEGDITVKKELHEQDAALLTSKKLSTEELLEKFTNDTSIEYAEPNYIRHFTYTSNDPRLPSQWTHHRNDDHDVDITDMWDIEQSNTTETTVAIIDSGVDYNFADLSSNMWNGGATYPHHGWDFVDNDNNPDDTARLGENSDFQWHGTYIASIIGAETDNGIGIAGMSRYNKIKMMAIRFDLDISSEIEAINFAKNNGAKVINASYSGEEPSLLEKDAINAFPGIFVAAASNGGSDEIGDNNDITAQYPCNYSLDNVICVGATNEDDNITDFSNYGESVDIAAPGENIIGIRENSYHDDYSGTSFSAPLVAGATALLYAHNPSLSINTVRSTLLQSSDHLPSLSGKIACSRRLNVKNAVQSVINNTIPSESCNSPVYRFANLTNGAYLYTANEVEKNVIINTLSSIWRYEGNQFYAHLSQINNTTPVYRFANLTNGAYLYTANEVEKNVIINTLSSIWRYEGNQFYAPKN